MKLTALIKTVIVICPILGAVIDRSETFRLYAFKPQPNGLFEPVIFHGKSVIVSKDKDVTRNLVQGNIYEDLSLKLKGSENMFLAVLDDKLVLTQHHCLSHGFEAYRNDLLHNGNSRWVLCETHNATDILVGDAFCGGNATDIVLNVYAKTGSIPNFPLIEI